MATWQDRQRVELQRCLESFEGQFREWEARTERSPWETHYTQVRAATALFGVLRDKLKARLLAGGDDQIEVRVLSAWRVWDAFRSRLAQRQEEMFQLGLSAADEIAWGCRLPVATAFKEAGKDVPKEPALSYLNGSVSPSALARDKPFSAEPVFGESLTRASEQLLERLPVPLIGLPWHEVFHAPGMLSIAHEMGHVVEVDFKLTPELDAAMKKASPERERDWVRWRAEVFADQFALRHCGPAYASMMADLLAPRIDTTPGDTYPPHAVRMELCFATVEAQGLKSDAEVLRTAWKERCAIRPEVEKSNEPFMKDVPSVVEQLGNVPFGAKAFKEVVIFGEKERSIVDELAAEIAVAAPIDPAKPSSAPWIAAAAWKAFEANPSQFEQPDATEEVFYRIVKAPGAGGRRGRARRSSVVAGGGRRRDPDDEELTQHVAAAEEFADDWLSKPISGGDAGSSRKAKKG